MLSFYYRFHSLIIQLMLFVYFEARNVNRNSSVQIMSNFKNCYRLMFSIRLLLVPTNKPDKH